MKAFAYGGALKVLPQKAQSHKKGGQAKPRIITEEIDRGPIELQNHKAAFIPGGRTEVEFYRDVTGTRRVRSLRVTADQGLELSESALGVLFAHKAISSQQRRAGDLWAIGRARDAGSIHPRIGFYEERIPGGHDGAVAEEEITNSIWLYRKGRLRLKEIGARIFAQVWNAAIESRLPAWFVRQQGMIARPADGKDRDFLNDGLEELIELYEVS